MTVIVYRDGVVAADSMEAGGDLRRGSVKKISYFDVDRSIAGAAGEGGDCEAFLAWKTLCTAKPELEPPGEGAQFEAFTVSAGGIQVLDYHLIPWTIDAPFVAIGNGAAIAIGAMEMGATAEQAVAAAIKWSPACGGDIYTLRLPT